MKKLLLAVMGMFLISCGGGWSNEEVQTFKDDAPRGMDKDMVDCILDAAQSEYTSFEDFDTAMDTRSYDVFKWMEEVIADCEDKVYYE